MNNLSTNEPSASLVAEIGGDRETFGPEHHPKSGVADPRPDFEGTGYSLNDASENYDRVKVRFSKKMLAKLLSHLPEAADVLEIGPGAGHFASECREKGLGFVGLEASEIIADQLTEDGYKVLQAVCPPIPLPSDSLDLVYSSMVLEHMQDANEATAFVREMGRVVRPGGVICLMFPNAYMAGKLFWEMDYTHGYFTTPRRVTQMCEQIRLEPIETQRVVGWFWVHSTPVHTVLRWLSNTFAWVINAAPVSMIAEGTGLGDVLWKFRKTFFESTILIVRKPDIKTDLSQIRRIPGRPALEG